MPVTVYDNGAVNTVPSGTFAGILVDVNGSNVPTTLNLSGSTSTGPNAHESYPPPTPAFSDVESGIVGIIINPTCVYTDNGGNTITGGDGLAGKTTESYDGTPALELPSYGPGDGLYSMGATITLGGPSVGSIYTGGNYTPGATGSRPTLGGNGVTILDPVAFSLGACTLQGGNSESTLSGAPGLYLAVSGTIGATLGGLGPSTPVVTGGTGVLTGQSAVLSNQGTGVVIIGGGLWTDGITLDFAPGSTLRVAWNLGGPYTLTTSLISGSLADGSTVSITLTGGAGGTVTNNPGYSDLSF